MERARAKILLELLRTTLGLMVFSFGVYLTIRANIGLSPWDAFSMGISRHTPLSYGTAHIAVSCAILLIDLLLREKIGYGTVLDALLVGLFVDLYAAAGIVPTLSSVPAGIAIMVAGLFIMSFGQFLYMSAAQCCGPRDALLVALGRRLPRVPIGLVNTALLLIAVLSGFLMGAPVGIGTLISTFGIGVSMQIVFHLLKFEPRSVVHRNLLETTRALVSGRFARGDRAYPASRN